MRSPASIPFFAKPSFLHLQRIGDIRERTWDRLFVQGIEIVNFEDQARLIYVGDRKRQRRVLHPERGAVGLSHNKKHAAVRRETLAKHQSRCALRRLISHFRSHRLPPHAERDRWQSHLRGILRTETPSKKQEPEKNGSIHRWTTIGKNRYFSHAISALLSIKKQLPFLAWKLVSRNSPVTGRK